MFESEIENTYYIEIHNGMTCINGNKVNKLAECNLLHEILNPPKRTENLNSHYYPIIQGCTSIKKGKAKSKKFLILLGSGLSSTILMGRPIKKINKKRRCDALAHASG